LKIRRAFDVASDTTSLTTVKCGATGNLDLGGKIKVGKWGSSQRMTVFLTVIFSTTLLTFQARQTLER
jgi:hypothetical protein